MYVKTEHPEWMRYDPTIQDEDGYTLAMIWIMNVETDPPEWMRYDPTFQDGHGNTLAMYWILCSNRASKMDET